MAEPWTVDAGAWTVGPGSHAPSCALAGPARSPSVRSRDGGAEDREDADLLALARGACDLGEAWIEDRLDFLGVTLAMGELQRGLWRAADHFRAAPPRPGLAPFLLATAPGEQHSFGLSLLHERLRRSGAWGALLPAATASELLAAAAGGRFAVIGLSVGSDRLAVQLAALAAGLRSASPRPVQIVCGGPAADALSQDPSAHGLDAVLTGDPLAAFMDRLRAAGERAAA